jgi:hypothetical protein
MKTIIVQTTLYDLLIKKIHHFNLLRVWYRTQFTCRKFQSIIIRW